MRRRYLFTLAVFSAIISCASTIDTLGPMLLPAWTKQMVAYLSLFIGFFVMFWISLPDARRKFINSDSLPRVTIEPLPRGKNLLHRSFPIDMLLPIDRSNDLHANLDEVEPLWVAAHGIKRARWIRRSQELQAIAKYWASPLKDAFKAVLKVIR